MPKSLNQLWTWAVGEQLRQPWGQPGEEVFALGLHGPWKGGSWGQSHCMVLVSVFLSVPSIICKTRRWSLSLVILGKKRCSYNLILTFFGSWFLSFSRELRWVLKAVIFSSGSFISLRPLRPAMGSYHKGPCSGAHPQGCPMVSGVGAALQPVKSESLFPRNPWPLWCLFEGPYPWVSLLGKLPHSAFQLTDNYSPQSCHRLGSFQQLILWKEVLV